jgi:predicted O-methyltransferase YrrM
MERVVPDRVRTATNRAEAVGFTMSCDPRVGQLLGVLAAALPRGGRILELGTGTGVGLAWIVEGLGSRADVEVVSVEVAPDIGVLAASNEWPDFVKLEVGDALEFIGKPECYDMIFADAQGGKWEGLEQTINSLRPGGLLLVDDMEPAEYMNDEHRVKTVEVREQLLASERISHVELNWATGLILCARRFPS